MKIIALRAKVQVKRAINRRIDSMHYLLYGEQTILPEAEEIVLKSPMTKSPSRQYNHVLQHLFFRDSFGRMPR